MLEPLGHIFFSFYFEDWMLAGLFMPCSISVKSWISGREEVKFCSSGQPLQRKRLWLLTLLKSLSFPVIRPLFAVGSEAAKSQPLRRCGSKIFSFIRSLNPPNARFILSFDRLPVASPPPPLRLRELFRSRFECLPTFD